MAKKEKNNEKNIIIQFKGTIYEQGYGQVSRSVMRDTRMKPGSKAIYAYLCSFAGSGESAFPSVSLMLHELQMGEEAFYKYRKVLVNLGYLEIENRTDGKGKFLSNLYTIVWQPVEKEEKEKEPYPENQGTDENREESTFQPYPENPGTENPCTENQGTNISTYNINSFKDLKNDDDDDLYNTRARGNKNDRQESKKIDLEEMNALDDLITEDPNYKNIVMFAKNCLQFPPDDLYRLVKYLRDETFWTTYNEDQAFIAAKKLSETDVSTPAHFFGRALANEQTNSVSSAVSKNKYKEHIEKYMAERPAAPNYNWLEERN